LPPQRKRGESPPGPHRRFSRASRNRILPLTASSDAGRPKRAKHAWGGEVAERLTAPRFPPAAISPARRIRG
jgi:hypothetical protein